MTDELAIDILQSVKECWKKGIKDDDLVVKELKEKYNGNDDDFYWIIEMIKTGIFRAGIMSTNGSYPKSNLKIEEIPILKAAFKMHWIDLKGEEHYYKNYGQKRKKWWNFFK